MKNIVRKGITSLIITTSLMASTTSLGAELKAIHNNNDKNIKWGFKDNSTGKKVVETKYDGVSEFYNGYAAVKLNKLWGFIDSNGSEIIPTKYAVVSNFVGGYAVVSNNNKWGIIDTSGREVIPIKYEEIYYFDSEGIAKAKLNSKWGAIDRLENTIIPFIYEQVDSKTEYTESISKIILDGEEIEFDSYSIYNNNYVKIRDIASVLSNSEKQFEVYWDKESGKINLLSGEPYTPVGGEFEKGIEKPKKLKFTRSAMNKDGEDITLKGYNIGDNNYFKIRDIAKEFNIGLTWDHESKTINIDTTQDYIE